MLWYSSKLQAKAIQGWVVTRSLCKVSLICHEECLANSTISS